MSSNNLGWIRKLKSNTYKHRTSLRNYLSICDWCILLLYTSNSKYFLKNLFKHSFWGDSLVARVAVYGLGSFSSKHGRCERSSPHPSRLAVLFTQYPVQYTDCVWNVMAHAQKQDFFFQRNGWVHLNRRRRRRRRRGGSLQSTNGSRSLRNSGSNVGYTKFRGSVKSIGYPLHSPVSPSLPLPCLTVCHHISTGLYLGFSLEVKRSFLGLYHPPTDI